MIRAALAIVATLAAAPAPAGEYPASYPEGPVWIDGALYWAEMGADRVVALDGDRPRTLLQREGCGPTALARYRADEILVLCHRAGELVRIGGDGRVLGTIAADAEGNRLRDPNDAAADGQGGVWFTDPGRFSASAPAEGALWHIDAAGRLTRHATGLAYGNGVFVDREVGRLLVSEHLARRVLAFPIRDGELGPPAVLIDLDRLGLARPDYPEAGPDGLELAPDGTLWVAEYGAGRLIGWRPGGGLAGTVPVPEPYVTNIAFGPDGRAAVTGASVNDRAPFPGRVRLLPAAAFAAVP